jgi:hypothetical protein
MVNRWSVQIPTLIVDGARLPIPLRKKIWEMVVDGKKTKQSIWNFGGFRVIHSFCCCCCSFDLMKFSRLECSVCGHSWFQSRDRLMTLSGGFEMVELPDMIHNRIKTNIEQGKSPKYTGDSKLYVGNIAFASTEKDIFDLFADIGEVGDVALVRDEIGRNRGFGFVTMRTKEGGEKAMEKLDGSELNGRNIAVRESNN